MSSLSQSVSSDLQERRWKHSCSVEFTPCNGPAPQAWSIPCAVCMVKGQIKQNRESQLQHILPPKSISQSDYILESTSVHDPRIFMKETSGVVRNCTSKYEKKMTFTSPTMELLFRVLQNPVNVYGNSLVIAVMICLCIKWERLEFHVNVL